MQVNEEQHVGDEVVERKTEQGQRRAAKCPNCRGRGSVRIGRGLFRTTEGCEDCRGTGRFIEEQER